MTDTNHRMMLEEFEKHQRRQGLSPLTIQSRRKTLRSLQRSITGNDLLHTGPDDINDWLDTCRIGLRTRRTYLAELAAFYRWAVGTGRLGVSPVDKIVRPKVPKLVPRPMRTEDIAAAFDQADPRMASWPVLAFAEGLRVSEIARLRREDVHDEAQPAYLVAYGKGSKERVVPLHPLALDVLRRYGMPATGYLFRNRYGAQANPATVSAFISRHIRATGGEGTAHRMRHWFATRIWQQTRDLFGLQALLGHASSDSTAIYAQFDPGPMVGAVAALTLKVV